MIYLKRTHSKDWDFKGIFNAVNKIQQEEEISVTVHSDSHSLYPKLSTIILVYEKRDPIAYLAVGPISNSSTQIEFTYVIPEFRKKGIAQMMLDEIELWAKEEKLISITVAISLSNPAGLILGIKSGFKILPNCPKSRQSVTEICLQKNF